MATKKSKHKPLTIPTMKYINKLDKEFKAISFFSGCGGSSTGHKLAKFDVLYANEFIPEAATTYRANHEHTKVDTRDIRKINVKSLMSKLGLAKGELDLLDGSPPCFVAGTKILTKDRGYVSIESVVEGDIVLSHILNWRKVTGTTRTRYKGPMVELRIQDKINDKTTLLECTPDHGMYVNEDGRSYWKSANSITKDTHLLCVSRKDIHIKSRWTKPSAKVTKPNFNGYVYNLHVDVDESYIANNIAVHNCSSFSIAGARDKGWGKEKKYSDSSQRTDDLFFEFTRMIKGFKPKTFVAENVPGLVTGTAKGYYLEIIEELRSCGYEVKAAVLDASRLDVPQARRRLIFVGVRNDLVRKGFHPVFPTPTPYTINVNSVLPNVVGIREAASLTYISAARPMFTITASDATTSETARFSCGAFIETLEGDRRKLNIKELKIVSSFPKDFILTGTFEQQFERIGRAVPPMMMFHVSKTIRDKILRPYYEI